MDDANTIPSCTGKQWGSLATAVSDPPGCITHCRQQFLYKLKQVVGISERARNISKEEEEKDYENEGSSDETLDASLCKVLSDMDHMGHASSTTDDAVSTSAASGIELFWQVYCCDSQLCGVDNLVGSGKDPNINWIINSCQNFGINDIVDPGPPESTYTCPPMTSTDQGPLCQMGKAVPTSTTIQMRKSSIIPTTSTYTLSISAPSVARVSSKPGTLRTETTPTKHISTSVEASYTSGLNTPTLSATLPTSKDHENDHQHHQMPTGVQVTIALSTLVGLLLIAALLLCSRRARRQRSLRRSFPQFDNGDSPTGDQGESPDPLLATVSKTPKSSGEHTNVAPPRLSERRLLPIVVRANNGSQQSEKRGARRISSSQSVWPSKVRKLVPRQERIPSRLAAKTPYATALKNLRSASSASLWAHRHDSVHSNQSPRDTASSLASTIRTTSGQSDGTVKTTTSRQGPRQGEPFDIPGLASPGPPPNRALPSTPPKTARLTSPRQKQGFLYSSSSLGNVRQGADMNAAEIGVAISSSESHTGNHISKWDLPQESRDLCELTAECAREARDSWGSWTGVGSGAPGMTTPSGRKEVSSPVLEEKDLEKLGGRY